MKRKHIVIVVICAVIFMSVSLVWGANAVLTHFIEQTSLVCEGQTFQSPEEAIEAMEAFERQTPYSSLDYCPPFKLVHTFDYENNTIVIYSNCYSFDGSQNPDYAVRILKHNDDGTYSFDTGFATLQLEEPEKNENYYYFTNIKTTRGNRSISFLYLDKDNQQDIYVDGNKAEKQLVSIDGQTFYLCYAISHRDTFLSNLLLPISGRHKIEIK